MAQYANLVTGINVGSASAIDKRFILTKEEMKTLRFADTGKTFKIPTHTLDTATPVYLAICKEDKKLYLYNDGVAESSETGHFHPIEEFLDYAESEAAKAKFDAAVDAAATVVDLSETVNGTDTEAGLVEKVATLQEEIQNIKIDGQVIGG